MHVCCKTYFWLEKHYQRHQKRNEMIYMINDECKILQDVVYLLNIFSY